MTRLPISTWNRTERMWNRWSSLLQRGWTKAAAIVCERLDDDLADLIHQLGTLRREINLSPPITIVASLPSIMADLRALHDEFNEVSIDLRRRMISVTTEPIILEGVELGPFAIEWSWMVMERPSHYRVWAIEPNTATSNESATHPHVSSGRLCEGEASYSIRQALSEGRLFDFFLIVRQVLRTYNASSAYVPIDEWYGPPCQECGTCTGNSPQHCGSCDVALCDDCANSCRECRQSLCGSCVDRCPNCEEGYCASCLIPCESCHQPYCLECLDENQLCPSCLETPANPTPDASLHPDSVDEDPNPA